MKQKALLSGMLGLALSVGLMSGAVAETFNKTITMSPGMAAQFSNNNLSVGDTLNLTLVNPTNSALTFETDAMLGTQRSWTIPANSKQNISFRYAQPFSDDVNFTVRQANGAVVSQGVLLPQGTSTTTTTTTTTSQMATTGDVFRKTITLGPNMGQTATLSHDELGVGDRVELTLVNPTNTPLTFTTDQALGFEKSWTIPAGSQRVISFNYSTPFNNDLTYQVSGPGGPVAQGVLYPVTGTLSPTASVGGQDIFRQTVTMDQSAGQISFDDLGVGDTLELTLVNPTNQPLVFETSQPLGVNRSWTVPAGGRQVVTYRYTTPFSDDVAFTIRQPNGTMVSQGTLIPSGGQTAQGQDQSIFQRQEQQTITTTDQQRTNSQRQMISQPQPTRTGGASSVRGYW